MKKKALRIVAVLFAFTLMLTGLNLTTETVSAASKKATKITLTATKKTLYVGQKTTLKVKSVKPSNASKSVTWKTSNSKVATVKAGTVTAKKAGKATITAVSKSNSKVKATCKVTVKNPTTTFTKKSLTVNAADKTDLNKYLKVNGKSKTVTWTTSNKKVATVSKAGKVTFKKTGTVTITAKANGKKATIKLTAPKLTISKTTATIWYPTKKTVSLSAKAYTVKGKKTTVKWTTSNSKIATVSKAGKVTFKKAGTVTITASANGVKKTCKVTAKQETTKLNKTSISLTEKQTYTLKATVAGTKKTVTWTTSNKAVATVKSGKVTAVKAGTATITATANGKKATCKVTVKKAPVKPVDPVQPTEKMIKYELSKDATSYEVKSNDRTFTVTQDEVIAKKERAVELAKKYGTDLEAAFNAAAVKGKKYTVRGRVATVVAASKNDATVEVANVHGKIDGTYNVTIVKVAEGKYTFTVKDLASNKTRSLTVNIKLANGVYTITTNKAGFDFTLTVKADGTSAKLVSDNGAGAKTVATYEETKTAYVATYNRTYLEYNLQPALNQFKITSVTAKEILERLDATTVTAIK